MDEAPDESSSVPRKSAQNLAVDQSVLDRARLLYDRCPSIKPAWDQLGGVTQSVWIERAQAGHAISTAPDAGAALSQQAAAAPPEPAASAQTSLF